MICKKCKGVQFYTRRLNHIPVFWVCGDCGAKVSIKKPKPVKEEKIDIKDGE